MPDSGRQYISLQEAAQYCGYSQEYLSLRARQGKLKAVKIGRNWVTTKEWVQGYEKKVKEYNNQLRAEELAVSKQKAQEFKLPELKLSFFKNLAFGKNLVSSFARNKQFLKPALGLSLVFVLVIGGIAMSRELVNGFNHFVFEATPYLKNIVADVSDGANDLINNPEIKENAKQTINTVGEYNQWLKYGFLNTSQKIVLGYSLSDDFVEKKIFSFAERLFSAPKAFANIFNDYFQREKYFSFKWKLPKIEIPEFKLSEVQLPKFLKVELPKFSLPKIN